MAFRTPNCREDLLIFEVAIPTPTVLKQSRHVKCNASNEGGGKNVPTITSTFDLDVLNRRLTQICGVRPTYPMGKFTRHSTPVKPSRPGQRSDVTVDNKDAESHLQHHHRVLKAV